MKRGALRGLKLKMPKSSAVLIIFILTMKTNFLSSSFPSYSILTLLGNVFSGAS